MTEIPSKEWILLERPERIKLTKGKNKVRDALARNWDLTKVKIAPGLSPIGSYYYHPLFTAIRSCSNFEVWKKVAFWRYVDCVREQQVKPLYELADRIQITPLIQFQYAQISSVVHQVLDQAGQLRRVTFYEIIVSMGQLPKGFLAQCYYLLNKKQECNTLCCKWAQEFSFTIDYKT